MPARVGLAAAALLGASSAGAAFSVVDQLKRKVERGDWNERIQAVPCEEACEQNERRWSEDGWSGFRHAGGLPGSAYVPLTALFRQLNLLLAFRKTALAFLRVPVITIRATDALNVSV